MTVGRCQICGRAKALNARGIVGHHHVRSNRCPGAGFPPIEITDERLVQYLAEVRAADRALCREYVNLLDGRVNYIDPSILRRMGELANECGRLERRLSRLHTWPVRFAREMERQGWGSPPPAWLIARYRENHA